MKWLPIVMVLLVPPGIWLLDRLLLWMEWRGWIFYRMSRPDSRSVGPAFLEIDALLQPQKRHILEQKVQQKQQEDDEGGPDEAGRHSSAKKR